MKGQDPQKEKRPQRKPEGEQMTAEGKNAVKDDQAAAVKDDQAAVAKED